MSGVYNYYMEKEQEERKEKEEALFNVPDQIEEVVSEVAKNGVSREH